ncbi:hypothetical protein E7T06_02505 [Deinococcus sp. Arct2-2]|uniref:pilus assembly PilX N-terminal domain-containing protein n=1 Tax=Deinococcus sp. Arct2-2 TaxID=2568653 RepID=UPI0010A31FF7|nr:pilus assembly PilX N-terminal domain-containing protein [Deinococcus sp. Arct2-2]THF71506.1 hypothetical protein E7T06_02505 [Deinococcus sp. Arct2-2]
MNISTHPFPRRPRTEGIALVTALIFMVVMLAVLTAYLTMTTTEVRTNRVSRNSVEGFYAAEGGLNMRAEQVREIFKGYLRPVGTAPNTSGGAIPCVAGNMGDGDMRCIAYTLNGRTVNTYMVDTTKYTSGNPETGVVGPGDTYAGLNYAQYAYTVRSEALNSISQREATLEMKFQSRLVPLFQFAAFYKDDLEFHPGPVMTLNGRVHTNANLYMNAGATLDITGKTSAAQKIFRAGKDGRDCAGTVRFSAIAMACNGFTALNDAQLSVFNKNVLSDQQVLTVPPMSTLNPDPTGANNSELWSRADLRIVAKRVGTTNVFLLEVRQKDGSVNAAATAALLAFNALDPLNPAVRVDFNTFWDGRERVSARTPAALNTPMVTLLKVNQKRLMDMIQATSTLLDPSGNILRVDDSTGGGLAIHLSFEDTEPLTNTDGGPTKKVPYVTKYGVKISNADRLGTTTGTPAIKGLTVITNQSLYTQGDYNSINIKPAALIADTINILSNAAVQDIKESYLNSGGTSVTGGSGPIATPTTVNAAFLSGVDETKSGAYNGGLQNYPRFHEDWGGVKFTYRGSFVSLGTSLHAIGAQSQTRYAAPNRDWNYDTDFNDANNLPPLTPRFVYLRQLLFARTW